MRTQHALTTRRQGHTKLAEYVEFKKVPKQDLRGLFTAAPLEGIDLLTKLLLFDPRKRITAKAVSPLARMSPLLVTE